MKRELMNFETLRPQMNADGRGWKKSNLVLPLRTQFAFTLVELLVVIAIIGILAALVLGTAGLAKSKRTQSRVETEREAMTVAIDSYYKARGHYPPDNALTGASANSAQTPLYYELTGTVLNPATQIFTGADLQTFNSTALNNLFGVSGFINCSNSETPSKDFFGGGLKIGQRQLVKGSSGNNYTVLGITVDGPSVLQAAAGATSTAYINPWHYVSSNPTNNHDSYDLWMDVKYAGKTNRISNWSKDPQIVN